MFQLIEIKSDKKTWKHRNLIPLPMPNPQQVKPLLDQANLETSFKKGRALPSPPPPKKTQQNGPSQYLLEASTRLVTPVFLGVVQVFFPSKNPPGENSRLSGLGHFSINDVQTLRYLVSSHRDAVGNPGGGSPVKGGARGGDFSHYLRMVF